MSEAEAVVSSVLERLQEVIAEEHKFLDGVGHQLWSAGDELGRVRAFLRDADARRRDNETLRICLAEIREAAYDLLDVIEIFVFDEGVDLGQIGSEIGAIRTRIRRAVDGIREMWESGGEASLADERRIQLRRTYSHTVERHVVGLEDSIEELVMQLVNDDGDGHRVVSIWGMGGSGKTTLARQVYHHRHVRRHFTSFAWVCLSPQFRVREVLEGILVRLTYATREQRKEIAEMTYDEIAMKLHRVQRDKRCLVVLDDIWSIEAWKSLEAAFPCVETRSQILLTTRNETVALHADIGGFHHQPLLLNQYESWQLFEKIAISGRNDGGSGVHRKMKELGEQMLRDCAGLPLAIVLLAGILAQKNTVHEWDMVQKNVYAYIRKGEGQDTDYLGGLWLLALSYDDLPYVLKPCFLYLANFPRDFEIPVKRLTQLWVADGLIYFNSQIGNSGETMEDVAYKYLSELVERGLVQVGELGSTGKIKTCRIHNLMRDLCLLKAEEENFLRNVNSSDRNSIVGEVRRLSIYLEKEIDTLDPPRHERHAKIRSLLYFGSEEQIPKVKILLQSAFKDFKVLRILKLEHMHVVGLPNEIGSMVLLRFLSLRKSSISLLPSSIGNLTCLQTLDFDFEWSSTAKEIIPNVLWKFKQLRHLYLPSSYQSGSILLRSMLKLSNLDNLQTLSGISSGNFDLGDLMKLSNLRKLSINVEESPFKGLEEIMRDTSSNPLTGIQSLSVKNNSGSEKSKEEVVQIVLSCVNIFKLKLFGLIKELPEHLQQYPNLIKISLAWCDLKDDQLTILEKLPQLTTLHLDWAFQNKTRALVFSNGGFRRLQFLSLGHMYGIEEWKVEDGAMPCLCRLHIDFCIELKTVPEGLRYITTLRELKVARMPRAFCSKLQEGGEDVYKIQHVRSFVLGEVLPD